MIDEIRQYILRQLAPPGVRELSEDQSLLEAGVIDSVGMIDVISHLEKTYRITVDEDDMTPENFDSIRAIASYVTDKQAAVSK